MSTYWGIEDSHSQKFMIKACAGDGQFQNLLVIWFLAKKRLILGKIWSIEFESPILLHIGHWGLIVWRSWWYGVVLITSEHWSSNFFWEGILYIMLPNGCEGFWGYIPLGQLVQRTKVLSGGWPGSFGVQGPATRRRTKFQMLVSRYRHELHLKN